MERTELVFSRRRDGSAAWAASRYLAPLPQIVGFDQPSEGFTVGTIRLQDSVPIPALYATAGI
jgi:hypothetical protein